VQRRGQTHPPRSGRRRRDRVRAWRWRPPNRFRSWQPRVAWPVHRWCSGDSRRRADQRALARGCGRGKRPDIHPTLPPRTPPAPPPSGWYPEMKAKDVVVDVSHDWVLACRVQQQTYAGSRREAPAPRTAAPSEIPMSLACWSEGISRFKCRGTAGTAVLKPDPNRKPSQKAA